MAVFLLIMQVLGALSSIHALFSVRTSQGTIAWIVSLNTLSVLAVPAYWVLGRSRFKGYVIERQRLASENDATVERLRRELAPWVSTDHPSKVGAHLAELPYFMGNQVDLLIDGAATFESIFAGIDAALTSILVQFYIVHDDGLGRELKRRLVDKAKAGLRVYFLYDEIGSTGLPAHYVKELRDAGVHANAFHSTRGSGNRFQLNFRNHRKIVVVDSAVGWVGGHNVGDEYLSKDPKVGHWRDTHMRVDGPAVTGLIVSFAEDWAWATGEEMFGAVFQVPRAKRGDTTVLMLPSGPADRLETASLMYQEAIQQARKRLWIASPYFVPDQAVMHALHLAALRGVDVRIVIPDTPDNKLVYYSAFALVGELLDSGARVYRWGPGFLHQKVFLVDDVAAGVGTANFDNRSFRLNFEISGVVLGPDFANQVARMLEADMAHSREMSKGDVEDKSFWFRLAERVAYLTSPIQ